MKKNVGFTSFEFYFVMAVISFILLIGLQHYTRLSTQTQRFAFEILAQRFNVAVYNYRVKWILSLQHPDQNRVVDIDDERVLFSNEGWPLAKFDGHNTSQVSIAGCLYLWNTLIQNPAPISYKDGDPYGSRSYHLSLGPQNTCRFEYITSTPGEYYFDYSPITGQIIIHTPPMTKDN